MAERKPLFIDTEGYPEEFATSDSASFGGLTLGGTINMGGNKVINGAAATANGDVLVFGQTGATLGANAYLGDGVTMGDTTLSGVLDMDGNDLTGLADTPAGGTSAVNKNYVDSVAQGLDVHPSVRLLATTDLDLNGTETIDTKETVDGDRVLVVGQADPIENGIYIVDADGPWTRALDLVTGNSAAGTFCFVEDGDTYADTGWVCTSNVGSDVVDTNDLLFSQFSGAGTYTAGDGLTLTGGEFDVVTVSGSSLVITGGKLDLKLLSTGGLQSTYVDGLSIKIDETPDTLDVDGDGLKVVGLPSGFKVGGDAVGVTVTADNLDTLTNGSDASTIHNHASLYSALGHGHSHGELSGVSADQHHSQYHTIASHDTVATGAQLDELVGSGLTTLHQHASAGAAPALVWTGFHADTSIALADPVRPTSADGVSPCNNSADSCRRFIGIAMEAAAENDQVDVGMGGVLEDVLTGATAGTIYYLDSPNGLTTTRPQTGNANVYVMGRAINATDLALFPQYLGKNM